MRNIALVTGASSGMGKEFVREISKKKYKGSMKSGSLPDEESG